MAYGIIIAAGCLMSFFTGDWMAALLLSIAAILGVECVKMGRVR